MHMLVFYSIDKANYTVAAKILEIGPGTTDNGGIKFNEDVAEFLFPIAKWAHIVGSIGRVVLLVISYKKPRISKIYFNYEVVMFLLDQCLVKNTPIDAMNFIMLLSSTLSFVTLYFDFWHSLLGIFICQVSYTIIIMNLY